MQKQAFHLHRTNVRVIMQAVGVAMLCFIALSFLAFHFIPRAYAASASSMTVAGSAMSSPASGPVGTTITVSGSGWAVADGTPVSFGYEAGTACTIVSNAANGTLGGSFSGSFVWPTGTTLTTFQVCAMLGPTVMALAGSFTVLPPSPPAVTISPTTLTPHIVATITANNYNPAGTQVNFSWMSGSTTITNLNSAISNASGTATMTFAVPDFAIASGTYTITAIAGSGQNMLSSTTSFTYQAPTVQPSPTPSPSPSPSPSHSPTPTPTTKPAITPTVTTTKTSQVSPTATSGTTPTISASATVASGGTTPTTNSTTPGNTDRNNTGIPPASSSNNTFLVGAIIAILLGLLLLTSVVAVMLISRRRKAARAAAQSIPPLLPTNPGQAPWSNAQGVFANNGAMPAGYPSYNTVTQSGPFAPFAGNMPAQTPAGAWASGNVIATASDQYPPSFPPVSSSVLQQPPAWMDSASSGSGIPAMAGSANPPINMPADPALDAMRRQAQAGLFVAPRPFSGREEPVGTL